MKAWIKNLTKQQLLIVTLIAVCFISSIIFVNHNHEFYDRPIGKITNTVQTDKAETVDQHQNQDYMVTQEITAEVQNGSNKGKMIEITNEYFESQAVDQAFDTGDEVFVTIDESTSTGTIEDVKRDKYLILVAWIFIIILLAIGKKQGTLSVISLAVNAGILSLALDIYLQNSDLSLMVICGISIVLFTVISLLLVSGFNEKTYTAIVATLLGTLSSLLIAYFALFVTGEQGLRYEEMSFLSRNPQIVFMAGLLIGSLGAVMDIAITLSSSIFELYHKNNNIKLSIIKKAGLEIGKDIMGTTTNILFFAYVSGSIPMLLLYFKNESAFGFTLSTNLSMELARALAGGIGIVLTIPITIYTSIFFIKRKQAKQ
ncbi:YibE/F family protein [Gracilibacillus suaedae]|uniref:YibE/F family protein n=1 Tax=Gracilibacillus suaedae TaxID=2820273 RepID=UPI001ABE4C21|nr:YibE/F family protein [Gracilibacillus suaedae]